ncbi:MAG: hypothetical protein Q4G04_05655 [bacterium]|nr:hypothetical protein [bacterium]
MILVVDNSSLKVRENKRLSDSINAISFLFSEKMRKEVTDNLVNYVGSVIVNTKDYVVGSYGHTKVENSKFIVNYGCMVDKTANEIISVYNFLKVLLTCKGDNVIKQNGCLSSQGIAKYDKEQKSFYGFSLNDGLCFVLAKLAVFNKVNRAIVNDYMFSGGFNTIDNKHIILEDLARLLMIASKNDYVVSYSFLEVLDSKEGIDSVVDDTPYCNLVLSALNNDFSMENEFDYFVGKGQFRKMCECLDKDFISATSSNRTISNSVINDIILKIKCYYETKLDYLVSVKFINSDKRELMRNNFIMIINNIVKNLDIKF